MSENTDDKEITKEYVAQIRKESEGHRLKAQETQAKYDALVKAHDGVKAELDTAKASLETETAARVKAEGAAIEAKKAADGRVLDTELKAAAKEAGLIDADVLKLIDKGALKVNDKGEIEGLAEVVEKFKTDKPHFFKAADQTTTTTTSTTKPPSAKPPGAKHASEMTPAEYDAARASFNKPNFIG